MLSSTRGVYGHIINQILKEMRILRVLNDSYRFAFLKLNLIRILQFLEESTHPNFQGYSYHQDLQLMNDVLCQMNIVQ